MGKACYKGSVLGMQIFVTKNIFLRGKSNRSETLIRLKNTHYVKYHIKKEIKFWNHVRSKSGQPT